MVFGLLSCLVGYGAGTAQWLRQRERTQTNKHHNSNSTKQSKESAVDDWRDEIDGMIDEINNEINEWKTINQQAGPQAAHAARQANMKFNQTMRQFALFDGLNGGGSAATGNANQTFISLIIKEIDCLIWLVARCALAPQRKDQPTRAKPLHFFRGPTQKEMKVEWPLRELLK